MKSFEEEKSTEDLVIWPLVYKVKRVTNCEFEVSGDGNFNRRSSLVQHNLPPMMPPFSSSCQWNLKKSREKKREKEKRKKSHYLFTKATLLGL